MCSYHNLFYWMFSCDRQLAKHCTYIAESISTYEGRGSLSLSLCYRRGAPRRWITCQRQLESSQGPQASMSISGPTRPQLWALDLLWVNSKILLIDSLLGVWRGKRIKGIVLSGPTLHENDGATRKIHWHCFKGKRWHNMFWIYKVLTL